MKKLFVMFAALMIISRVALAGEAVAPKAMNASYNMNDKHVKAEKKEKVAKKIVKVETVIIKARNERKCVVSLFSEGLTEVTYSVLDMNDNILFIGSEKVNGQKSKLFNFENVAGAVTIRVSDSNGLLKYKTL